MLYCISRLLREALTANPFVVETNFSKLFGMVSERQNDFVTYVTNAALQQQLKFSCNLQALELPSIDENFARGSYILRRGLPKEVYANLDLGLMALRDLSARVG